MAGREACWQPMGSVHLLHSGPGATTWRATHTTARHASLRHFTTTSGLVYLHHDGVHDALELLLLPFELVLLGQLVLVQPVQSILHGLLDFLFVAILELLFQLLQAVLGLDLLLAGLVLSPVLLCFLHHAVN